MAGGRPQVSAAASDGHLPHRARQSDPGAF